MEINTVYNKIKEKLHQSNYDAIVNDLDTLTRAGSTGGEILFSIGKYLSDLKMNKPLAYSFITEEVQEYLKYCEQSGLIIK